MTIELLIENFWKYLKLEKNCSAKTLENYEHYLGRFLNWLKLKLKGKKKFSADDITQEIISEFKIYLRNYRDQKNNVLKLKTQNYHLIALREFLRYLQSRGIKSLSADKVELEKEQKQQIEFLQEEEIKKMLDLPWKNTFKDLRDKAILEILLGTGLRVSELCSLNRDRAQSLPLEVQPTLKKYLEQRTDKSPALFIRILRGKGKQSNNLRLTPRSVQRIIRNLAVKTGIMKKVTPQSFRHLFALKIYQSSGSQELVKKQLGLNSLSTVRIYQRYLNEKTKNYNFKD